MNSTLTVVQVSESAFSVQGHGVHTAFIETVRGLTKAGVTVCTNRLWGKADIRHIHTTGPYSLLHLLFGSGKKIVSAHVVPASFVGSLKGAKYWLGCATWYLRWFYNRADVVIAVSDATKTELRRIGVSRPIEVIHNMVDTRRYHYTAEERKTARTNHGFTSGQTIIISNGQVQPRKRADTFVRLARELPNLTFVWVGGMPFGSIAADTGDMQKMIDSAPANVTFTGVVDLEQVREYFIAGDIFIMPSEQETFGLAIVEAAASDLPVVLRDIHDYDTTFRPYAVMCKEEEFVFALKKLVTDTGYYVTMQHQAQKLAKQYDSTPVTERLLAVYRSYMVK